MNQDQFESAILAAHADDFRREDTHTPVLLLNREAFIERRHANAGSEIFVQNTNDYFNTFTFGGVLVSWCPAISVREGFIVGHAR